MHPITGKVLLQRGPEASRFHSFLVTASHTQAGLHCTCQLSSIMSPNTNHTLTVWCTLFVPESTCCTALAPAHQLAYSLGRQASTNLNGSPETKGGNKGAFVGGALTSQGDFPRKSCNQSYPLTTPSTEIKGLKALKYDPIPQNSGFTNKERSSYTVVSLWAERLVLPRNIKRILLTPSLPACRG